MVLVMSGTMRGYWRFPPGPLVRRMARYKLTIEYDGRPFVGWQRQANGLSVQQAVEEAILRFCGEEVRITAAGRTDAGVHAIGQVAHADIARPTDPGTVRDAPQLPPEAAARGDPGRGGGGRPLRRPHLRHPARLSLPHRQPPRAAGAGGRPGLAGVAAARRRGDARGGAAPGRPSRLHQLPRRRMPGQVADADDGPAGRGAPRRGGRDRGRGAVLPAPPDPQYRRHAEAGGRGQAPARLGRRGAGRPQPAPPPAPPRRRTAYASCGCATGRIWRPDRSSRPAAPTPARRTPRARPRSAASTSSAVRSTKPS